MKSSLDRRQFIGAATATTLSFNFFPSRVFGANDRVNVAGIGVGGKGASDVSGVAGAGANIVALCDVDQSRAAATFKKFPKAKRHTDFRLMLENQKDIDAVTISTPDHTHAFAASMAMQMGKHCYCQKPLTHSVYEARVLAELSKEFNVVTQMGNQAHAGEPIRRAVELIRAGVIGDVTEVHIWTNRPIWPQGLTRPSVVDPIPNTLDWELFLGPAPDRPYNHSYTPFKWRGWWDFGTGALGDMACHIMDMAYWSLELGAPTSVDAIHGGNTLESPPNWSTVTYEFPKRGIKPAVKLVWYDGKREGQENLPAEDILEGQNPKRFGAILQGTKGKLFFNRGSTDFLIKHTDTSSAFSFPPISVPRTKNEDYEWIEGIKGGPTPLSNFAKSGPFSEMVLLGNVAIRTGKRIEWDPIHLRAKNTQAADQFIKREYRKGWHL